MNKRTFILVLSALAVLALLLPIYTFNSSAAAEPAPLRLKFATFNPGKGERPSLPPGLQIAADAQSSKGYWYYIVQFDGPVQQSWKDELTARGAEILEYIPDFAFKVRMRPGQAKQVADLPEVKFIDFYHPAYKESPDLKRQSPNLYKVLVESGVDAAATAAEVAASGAQVLAQDGQSLLIAADSAQLDAAANVVDVAWIENFAMFEKHNESSGGGLMGGNAPLALGYDGSTQIIAIADTGLGSGAAATAHIDIPPSRIVAIYNWRGVDDTCWKITDDGAVDVDSGHGTHVAVSALGDGGVNNLARGAAPGARLVFQAVENWATMIGACAQYYPNGYYLTGLPSDLRTLYLQAYNAGARIHSNSWGSEAAGAYTVNSAAVDDFTWTHPDMLITFSAGNSGIDANADGIIDSDSLNSPATAKNSLAVGASESHRMDQYPCDTTNGSNFCAFQSGYNRMFSWGEGWPSRYPANPIRDDYSGGGDQQMAAFSSRGPTDDGRIKPDVVAPGTWILSGYSDMYQQGYDSQPNPVNGAWQYPGWGNPYDRYYKYMGGTSMSNPLVAGGAAVVRDFFQKVYNRSASAALVKAMLINSARDLLDENNDGVNDNAYPIPNVHEGWGMVNLANATDGSAQFVDNTSGLSTSGNATYQYNVAAAGSAFKVTLAWTDYASSDTALANLVNDLDLVVASPSGVQYRGNVFSGGWSQAGGSPDRVNNVENVYIQSAEAGAWIVTINGYNVPYGPQPFALVVDAGQFGGGSTPTAAPTPTATATAIPTATPLPTIPAILDTGLLSPTTNSAVTRSAGDNNGFEVNPGFAYVSDNQYAVDNNSGSSAT